MSTLRISDAPLLPDVDGTEKIPTGGRGDYAISVDQIKDHIFQDFGKELVGLGNVDNTSDLDKPVSTAQQAALNLKADKTYVDTNLDLKADKTNVYTRSETTLALSQKADLVNGVIPENQIPNSFNDVLEFTTPNLPIVGEGGKIYVTTDTNKTWRWATNKYVEISGWNPDSVSKRVTTPTYNNAADGVDPVTGVAEGAYFNVRSSSDDSYIEEYQNVGGSAVATGKSYPSSVAVRNIAKYTALPFVAGKTYGLYERVQLANGDIVKSTIADNTANPNVDMTGWSVVDHNNSDRFHPLDLNIPQNKISTNFAASLNALISKVSSSGGGTILIPDGDYTVLSGQAVSLKDNIELVLGRGAKIKYARSGYTNYAIIEAIDVSNVKISGGVIDGNRDEHVVVGDPTKYWKMRTPSTDYVVGDYVYIHHIGYKVVTSGTTGAGLRPILANPTIGAQLTDGTVVFEVYNTNVGEWGMGIDIRGSTGVTVEDVYVKNCWGDGVYIGRTANKAYSEDVTLTRVVTDFCRRQGVSIVSVKGLKMDKLTAKNIRGTSPEGGIDFEPNNDDEFLLGISLTDYTATGCWGAGIHSFLGKFNSLAFEQAKVGITGINCRSIGNGSDLYMNGSTNSLVKGTVTFHNSTFADAVSNYSHANPYGVWFENNHADSIQWSYYDCTFRRSVNTGQANIRSTSVASLHGGLHLYRPTFVQVSAPYDATIMMNTAGAYKNISVVDPLTQPNTVPMWIRGACENLVISDNFNVWGYSQTADGTYDFIRVASVVNISNGVTLTVNTNQPFRKQRFRALNSATLAIGLSANINNYPKPYSFSMRADDWIELSCNASGIWKVVGASPTLNTDIKAQFSVPSEVIPANGKRSLEFDLATVVTGSSLSFNYNINLANLGVIASGYCLTPNKVTLQLINTNSTEVTLPSFVFIVTRIN